ncbi:hypothetical protein CYMTET_23864 [Cymbomonas tetramitiformis]|uniref:Uncharacterized protein n=1 Tax=Cymbomonas tetramitiformis TaxID=36881 RepID=A0AAE0L0V0_9CHLO|nr:hypothetical protein CYMTET_23864 [Cymbomonas tetramitiformis]
MSELQGSNEQAVSSWQAGSGAALTVMSELQGRAEDERMAAALRIVSEQHGGERLRQRSPARAASQKQAGALRTALPTVPEQHPLGRDGSSATAVPISLTMRHASGALLVSAVANTDGEQSRIESSQAARQIQECPTEGARAESKRSPLMIESAHTIQNGGGRECLPEIDLRAPAGAALITCDNALFEVSDAKHSKPCSSAVLWGIIPPPD